MNASQKPSYQAMAQQFLECWQQQVSQTMRDPQLLHSMMEMMLAMQQVIDPEPPTQPFAQPQRPAYNPAYADTPPASYSPYSGPAAADGWQLVLQRLDELEQRLARMETQLSARKPAAGAKPRHAARGAGKKRSVSARRTRVSGK